MSVAEKTLMRVARGSSAGFAGATMSGGRLRKGGEAPLRVEEKLAIASARSPSQ